MEKFPTNLFMNFTNQAYHSTMVIEILIPLACTPVLTILRMPHCKSARSPNSDNRRKVDHETEGYHSKNCRYKQLERVLNAFSACSISRAFANSEQCNSGGFIGASKGRIGRPNKRETKNQSLYYRVISNIGYSSKGHRSCEDTDGRRGKTRNTNERPNTDDG